MCNASDWLRETRYAENIIIIKYYPWARTLKFNSGKKPLETHFQRFDRLIRDLKSTGATLDETDVVCHLLLTMPSEYDTIVTALETLTAEALTTNFVKARLRDEEMKRSSKQKGSKTEATQPSTAFSTNQGTRKNKDKRNYKCHNCGKVSHFRSQCKRPPKSEQKTKTANAATDSKTRDAEEAEVYSFAACITEGKLTSTWCLDSGASEHLVRSPENINNVRKLKCPVNIKIAKTGVTLKAEKVGELLTKSKVDDKYNSVIITNVLIVPGLEMNLLSVRRLEMNGFTVTFKDGQGTIQKEGKVIAVAKRDKLYELNLIHNVETANFSAAEQNFKLWYLRLGHISDGRLKRLTNITEGINVHSEQKSSEICEICVRGKQTKLPHNKERRRATRPFQLIHSDLFGPVTPTSHDGKRYFLTFIDDFTHFTVAYPIKAKSEVFRYFKLYESMVTAHFNCKISRFRCDNGRKYISKQIRDHFEEHGIQFEFTVPYTPE